MAVVTYVIDSCHAWDSECKKRRGFSPRAAARYSQSARVHTHFCWKHILFQFFRIEPAVNGKVHKQKRTDPNTLKIYVCFPFDFSLFLLNVYYSVGYALAQPCPALAQPKLRANSVFLAWLAGDKRDLSAIDNKFGPIFANQKKKEARLLGIIAICDKHIRLPRPAPNDKNLARLDPAHSQFWKRTHHEPALSA